MQDIEPGLVGARSTLIVFSETINVDENAKTSKTKKKKVNVEVLKTTVPGVWFQSKKTPSTFSSVGCRGEIERHWETREGRRDRKWIFVNRECLHAL